jgi:hypothetical protein
MSYSTWAAILAFVLAAPPAIVFTFSNVFAKGDLFIFHGGSLMNEAPAPVAGAGAGILLLSVGACALVRRFGRKQVVVEAAVQE